MTPRSVMTTLLVALMMAESAAPGQHSAVSITAVDGQAEIKAETEVDFVDQWFLMGSPIPMATITLTYIIIVLKIGPDYMQTRKPYILKNVMVLYNIVQVFISTYLFYLMSTLMYYYFLAKVTELLDTVFFILRKKDSQITFLHVYHHAMMVLTSWSILKYEPTYATIFIRTINSFVHVIMYAYYGLSSIPTLKKYLWWKKYITRLQLGQFTLILIHFVMTYTTSECIPSYPLCLTISINTTLFIFLFGKFYMESYSKKENIKIHYAKSNQTVVKSDVDKVENKDIIKIEGNDYKKVIQQVGNKNKCDLMNRKKLMNGNK